MYGCTFRFYVADKYYSDLAPKGLTFGAKSIGKC